MAHRRQETRRDQGPVLRLDPKREKLIMRPDAPLPRFYPPPTAVAIIPLYDDSPFSIPHGQGFSSSNSRTQTHSRTHSHPPHSYSNSRSYDNSGSSPFIPDSVFRSETPRVVYTDSEYDRSRSRSRPRSRSRYGDPRSRSRTRVRRGGDSRSWSRSRSHSPSSRSDSTRYTEYTFRTHPPSPIPESRGRSSSRYGYSTGTEGRNYDPRTSTYVYEYQPSGPSSVGTSRAGDAAPPRAPSRAPSGRFGGYVPTIPVAATSHAQSRTPSSQSHSQSTAPMVVTVPSMAGSMAEGGGRVPSMGGGRMAGGRMAGGRMPSMAGGSSVHGSVMQVPSRVTSHTPSQHTLAHSHGHAQSMHTITPGQVNSHNGPLSAIGSLLHVPGHTPSKALSQGHGKYGHRKSSSVSSALSHASGRSDGSHASGYGESEHGGSGRPFSGYVGTAYAPSGGSRMSTASGHTGNTMSSLNGGGRAVKGDREFIEAVQRYLKLIPPNPHFCWSNCTGKKKAVCIGINYVGQKDELNGCANDARNMRKFLMSMYGFQSQDILMLIDDTSHEGGALKPTKEEMFNAMAWLVKGAKMHDSLFFHYSGHGGQSPDASGREADGMDETIYPVDYDPKGDIIDDELYQALVETLPAGCRLTAIFDSCHSGTVLDLPYLHSAHGRLRGINHISTRAKSRGVAPGADVICFAACKDDETSADTFHGDVATGAMSYAFIESLKTNPHQTYEELLTHLRDLLIPKYHQKAQISGTHPLDLDRQFTL